MNLIFLVFISAFFVIIGIISKIRINRLNKKWSIPKGKIIYEDLNHNNHPLTEKKEKISGKPDYIIQTKKKDFIPIEIKTGYHTKPKPWHVLQLITYCFLVSETYEQVVPYGILIYTDTKKQFTIPFDKAARSQMFNTIHQMMNQCVDRNHDDPKRCMHCSFRLYCSEKLE